MTKTTRMVAGVLAAVAAFSLAPSVSQANVGQVTAARNVFLPSPIVMSRGGDVTFTNLDTAVHSVTAVQAAAGTDRPLFDSGLIGFAANAPVAGVSSLPASQAGYEFYCVMHTWMRGRLIVA